MTGSRCDRFPRPPAKFRELWASTGWWKDALFHDVFDETVALDPGRVALITEDRQITMQEWKDSADALAAGLLGMGLGKGTLVSVQLPNCPEMCLLQIALSRAGAVIQPMHMVYREREIKNFLEFCESDAVVVPDAFGSYPYGDTIRKLKADLPRLKSLIVVGGKARADDERTIDDVIDEGSGNLDRLDARLDPDDVFYLNFTSGTEGKPKGFMHTHNTLISPFKRAAEFMRKASARNIILACSPMTHSFGHFSTYGTALGTAKIVLLDRFDPEKALRLIEQHQVTSISGTPAHLIGLVRHEAFKKYDTSSVRNVGVGGARVPPEFVREIDAVWGVATGNSYGLGENLQHTRTTPFDSPERAAESVGKPIPGAELRIVDPETRTAKETGDIGEIAFRGPTLFVGYYRQPELTRKVIDDDAWFYTGDLGYVDEDGYLYFVGRHTERINRGGSKIDPKEIEDLLYSHPKIDQVAVVGMPDFRLGEIVCAYVVTRGSEALTLDEVADYLRERKVMKYMFPQELVIMSTLPMTPTGKIKKAALQEDAKRRASKRES